jgi:hypothetical protein
MGYCYQGNQLVCDCCGTVGGVRKVRCPFGYCPPTAACPECRRKHSAKLSGKEAHRKVGCERLHLEFERREQEGLDMLNAGKSLRCSAMSAGPDRVHVLFRDKAGATTGYYMSDATYASHALGANVTPEMYEAFGPVEPAPSVYEWGTSSKEVCLGS